MDGSSREVFVLMSFEGPDRYAQVGGLATRVSGLAEALASAGHETHLVFIGDPTAPGEERRLNGKLIIHRWCQWLSRDFPRGVYDGEDSKRVDLTCSAPPYIVEHIAGPAIKAGKRLVVISEEWQTSQAAIELSDQLHQAGLRDSAELLWNANHTYGLDRVDWPRLVFTNRITTVSRFMRAELLRFGINAEVLPNGIPRRLLRRVGSQQTAKVRSAAQKDMLFFKMARWAKDKGWPASLEAVAQLRAAGYDVGMIARGNGDSQVGEEVASMARGLGLTVADAVASDDTLAGRTKALEAARDADVVFIRSFVDEQLGRSLYAAADGVLANSSFEPFGLVGLEAMAAGGVAYTGGTGEDYALPGYNAVVLETEDPREIVDQAKRLARAPHKERALRRAGQRTAAAFTWDNAAQRLVRSVRFGHHPG
ncbi:MAG TPA: glycosyltransferase family 4 protein [Chloroflexota bacterium]|nr:glycosyltransferase family 4 protein [Chloroflexota bacterium]